MAGRACTICTNPRRADIDAALLAGTQSIRRIAPQFGLAERSVRRHRAHIQAAVNAAEAARTDSAARYTLDLRATLAKVLDEAYDGITTAKQQNDLRARFDGLRTVVHALRLLPDDLGNPWAELTPEEQLARIAHVRAHLDRLEAGARRALTACVSTPPATR